MPVPLGKRIEIIDGIEALAVRNRCAVSCMINLTMRCNLRCRHCYQAGTVRGPELTVRSWERVFDNLASCGVFLLTFSGGEPLIREDFFKLALAARKRRFCLRLKTNGWLLDRDMVGFLSDCGFDEVHLSLYSSRPSVHDSVAGREGSWERVVRGASLLRERGIGVRLSSPLMRVNARDIEAIERIAQDLGCESVVDPALVVCRDGTCGPAQLRASTRSLKALYSNPRLLSRAAVKKEARARRSRESLQRRVCNVGRTSVVVDPAGNVLPCALLDIPLGNLLCTGLREIWQGNATLAWLRSLTWGDLRDCPECKLRPWCNRCHANALVEDGDLLGPSTIACQLARAKKLAIGRH